MLIRGESLVDVTGIQQLTGQATMLVASFLFMLAIFVLAVLVTILTASSMLDFEQVALHSYWQPILGCILSTDTLVNEKHDKSLQKNSIEVKKAHLWDTLTRTLIGGVSKTEGGLFVYPLRSAVMTGIIAVFIFPLWFVLGFASLGLLWPPQLRRYLFRLPTILSREESPKHEQARTQLTDVRNEILQMKCMSYERSQKLENEISEIKALLLLAIQD
jgi:hypothetical protein